MYHFETNRILSIYLLGLAFPVAYIVPSGFVVAQEGHLRPGRCFEICMEHKMADVGWKSGLVSAGMSDPREIQQHTDRFCSAACHGQATGTDSRSDEPEELDPLVNKSGEEEAVPSRGQPRPGSQANRTQNPSDRSRNAEARRSDPQDRGQRSPDERRPSDGGIQPDEPTQAISQAPTRDDLEALLQDCIRAETRARQCCNNPVQCMDSSSTMGGGEMALLASFITSGAAATGNGGLSSQCQSGEILGQTSAVLNTAMAGACVSTKNTCSQTCGEALAQMQRLQTQSTLVSSYLASAQAKVTQCGSYSANVTRLTNQAAAGALAARLADACRKEAQARATGFDRFDPKTVFNNNCSDPANASNPLCQKVADSRTDSLGDGSSRSTAATTSTAFGGRSEANVGFPDVATQQVTPTGAFVVPTGEARANAVGSAPTGFASGAGGFPGASGGSYSGISAGSGYETNILKGTGGSGGYSSSSTGGFRDSGGFAGYGSGSSSSDGSGSSFGFGFLRKYLPGGGESAIRGPASATEPLSKLAPDSGLNLFRLNSQALLSLCRDRWMFRCAQMDLAAWAEKAQDPGSQRVFFNFIEMAMPVGWTCQFREGSYVCTEPKEAGRDLTAAIVLTSKNKSPQDNVREYYTRLSQGFRFKLQGGPLGFSEVKRIQTVRIQGIDWADGFHKNSEIDSYYSRYLATVNDEVAALASFHVHEDFLPKYRNIFSVAAESLRLRPKISLKEKGPSEKFKEVYGHHMDMAPVLPSDFVGSPGEEDAVPRIGKILLWGVTSLALLALVLFFGLRRFKQSKKAHPLRKSKNPAPTQRSA